MPDRTEDTQEIEALDRRVDELLADVEETAGRIDAAIPDPPGDEGADQFASAESVLGVPPAASPPRADGAEFKTLPSAPDDLLREASEEIESSSVFASTDAALEKAHRAPAPDAAETEADEVEAGAEAGAAEASVDPAAAAAARAAAAELSGPDAISKLDEKLAASATELSSEAGKEEAVDDSEVEAQVKAEESAEPVAPAAPVPASVSASVSAPTPVVAAPMPAPIPAPVVPAAKVEPAATAAIVEAKPRRGLGMMLAAVVRPLADFTNSLSAGTRQTIAYAAVVTLFQAACLWGFLAFKGPPGEPMPTSDPVILRQAGDPPAAAKRTEPKKAAAKPKAEGH